MIAGAPALGASSTVAAYGDAVPAAARLLARGSAARRAMLAVLVFAGVSAAGCINHWIRSRFDRIAQFNTGDDESPHPEIWVGRTR